MTKATAGAWGRESGSLGGPGGALGWGQRRGSAVTLVIWADLAFPETHSPHVYTVLGFKSNFLCLGVPQSLCLGLVSFPSSQPSSSSRRAHPSGSQPAPRWGEGRKEWGLGAASEESVGSSPPPPTGLLGDLQQGPCSLWTSAVSIFPGGILLVPGWASGRRLEGQNTLLCLYRGARRDWAGGCQVHQGMK